MTYHEGECSYTFAEEEEEEEIQRRPSVVFYNPKCSYRRAELEEKDIQRRSSACSL